MLISKMLSIKYGLLFCCFTLFIDSSLAAGLSTNITIFLNKTTTLLDKELYADFIYLNRSSTIQVTFADVRKNISFIIFQVHSHLYQVTLSNDIVDNNFLKNESVTGTNVGLYSSTAGGLDTYHITNSYNNMDLKLFIAVQGYSSLDPIPGGCNMEFPIPISPYMRVTVYNKMYIFVDASPPRVPPEYPDTDCLFVNFITINFYMMYLPEQNFGSDAYFDAIRNMTTVKNILRNGRLIDMKYWQARRMISAYPGTGAVYVAIAELKEYKSAYVPTYSYACSPLVEDDCELLNDALSMLLVALLFFLGIFICYFGHRFFKTQTFLIGFFSGVVVTYILLSLIFTMDLPATIFASLISGLLVGAFRVVAWWIYGLPVLAIILTSVDIGFLTSSVMYYVSPGHMVFLQNDVNFWSLFILIILLITLFLLTVSSVANLVCCAVIGAYAAIYSLDFYLGSNTKYILNNVIKRATLRNFNKAVLMPPFQWRDWLITFLWLFLATTGFLAQLYQNKGKPPFPPPPRSVRAVPEEPVIPGPSGYRTSNNRSGYSRTIDERTPLLT